jgi:hypothetical protein
MPGPEFLVPEGRIEDIAYQIEVFGERAEHMKPVLEDIMDKILNRNRRNFETRGATSGIYWAPLRKRTVQMKIAAGVANPLSPLRFHDSLMRSLSERGAKDQILEVNDEGLRLETTNEKASYHESGTSKMPRRPPMTIPALHAREYIKDLNDFIFGEGNA